MHRNIQYGEDTRVRNPRHPLFLPTAAEEEPFLIEDYLQRKLNRNSSVRAFRD